MPRHIQDLIATRRALLGGLAGLPLLNLAGCATAPGGTAPDAAALSFASVSATNADTISLPDGYEWRVLIAWGDALYENMPAFDPDALTRADQERRFGMNNDMLALFPRTWSFPPARDSDDLILCANNEYANLDMMFPGVSGRDGFTPAHTEAAFAATGASVVALKRIDGVWRALKDAQPGAGLNRRITPFTPVYFSGPAARHPWIAAASAIVNAQENHENDGRVCCGTTANCAGGQTPWGTYLSSEENFAYAFSLSNETAPAYAAAAQDPDFIDDCETFGAPKRAPYAAAPPQFDMANNPHGPSLYGWVVEIDPYDPEWASRKRTALGRKEGECATSALTRDGRVAIYMGDDKADQFVYKFITRDRFNPADRTANRDLLDHGQLYVAQFHVEGGRWAPITLDAVNAAARARGEPLFADEGDLMMRVRKAAALLDATPMDRPEDVEAILDDNWIGQGPVLVVCTKNQTPAAAHPGNPRRPGGASGAPQINAAGHVLRIDEAGGDCGAMSFSWNVFLVGGDPDASDPIAPNRDGAPTPVANSIDGVPTFTGDRFACPDNVCFDRALNVWIATDGSDDVFADCNDAVLAAPTTGAGPHPVRRFLVGPVGAEVCGPTMMPDERGFLVAIQHPGENDVSGALFRNTRWQGAAAPSQFPDGGWPRSSVAILTRADLGRIGS